MTNTPKRIGSPNQSNRGQQNSQSGDRQSQSDSTQKILGAIAGLEGGLQNYPIRDLVQHAQEFGPDLRRQRLETNQVRKFLDAVNRLKADLTEDDDFSKIETEVVLLKPKLAYAAARQEAVKPLNRVMSAAIDQVHDRADFDRLVQLIESIIAYHKAEGGK